MGLARTWTKSETEYLCENWGTVSVQSICEKLNRSENAIKVRKNKLGLGPFLESGDYISLNQLYRALGRHGGGGYLVTSWIKNRGFPVKNKTVNQCRFRVVQLDEFWEWAEINRTFLDFSKIPEGAIGLEPSWVREQRRADELKKVKYRVTPWTKEEEDALLKQLLKQHSYSYFELSKMLCRTSGAIQRRVLDLGLRERPVKAETHNMWTDAEYELLAQMLKSGHSYELMAERLGRSSKAIRGRVFNMYLSENIDKVRGMIGTGLWGEGRPERKIKQKTLMSISEKEQVTENIGTLAYILLQRARHLSPVSEEFKDYWQKDMCMNWSDIKGCTAREPSCDSCTTFIRIREQYCRRCGATFLKRTDSEFCDRCLEQRKKQAQRKWAVMQQKSIRKEA